MSSRVVKCGVAPTEGLISTVLDQGRLICSNCGTVVSDQLRRNNLDHIFYEFIGAFCPVHLMIHYRWVMRDWELMETPLLRTREPHDPIIIPKKTEVGAEKYFMKSYYWNSGSEHDGCFEPGYTEVVWSDFEDSTYVLLRPQDTGYLKINSRGIHTPYIGALFEWILKKDRWPEIAELASNSDFPKREKHIISKAVSQPTPSNIFKLLWTLKRFIPGWNHKRSLGKRSPSMLIIDEIRWTINRLGDLTGVDRDRLLRYGPEPQYWNVWPDLWPEELDLADNLMEFGPELKRIGIHYGETLNLIRDPNTKNNERSWMEIADKMIQWPISYSKGGEVDLVLSQRDKQGFVANLVGNLQVAISTNIDPPSKWEQYLMVNLPLSWQQNGGPMKFQAISDLLTKSDLQETLKVLQPWIAGETTAKLNLSLEHDPKLDPIIQSFLRRLENTSIQIEETG